MFHFFLDAESKKAPISFEETRFRKLAAEVSQWERIQGDRLEKFTAEAVRLEETESRVRASVLEIVSDLNDGPLRNESDGS